MVVEQTKKLKVYIPNTSRAGQIGGGWTFLTNLRKGLKGKVELVEKWQDADIVFIFSITTMDKGEVYEAKKAGKKLVLRVDNIPRKSRNKRQSPAERLREFGAMADMVVYQSKWAKKFAGYFAGDGIVINNGVNPDIFNTKDRITKGWDTYLYIDYNPNPFKRFDEAIYRFEMEWRKNINAQLILAGNVPKMFLLNPDLNYDLNVPAIVVYEGVKETPEDVAMLMKRCDYLIYPSFAEAYPNTVLEAMACGVTPIFMNPEGGSMEAFDDNYVNGKGFRVKTIQEMADEYIELFNKIIKK